MDSNFITLFVGFFSLAFSLIGTIVIFDKRLRKLEDGTGK